MSEQPKVDQNKVVQLNPERGAAPHVALTRLPASMHSLRDKARQQLQVMLRELFDRADDALFELADKAGNNHEQNLYFESMREVRIRRRAMEAAFFRSIDVSFAQLLDPYAYRDKNTEEREISLDELSLVKNDELEEMVATEGMINKANDQFAEAIQHLTLRIDHLVPVKVYQKNNPLGADVICNAFTEAAKLARIDVKAKLVLFKMFDNLVVAKLGSFFSALNQLLIEANILPSLKGATVAKKPASSAATYPASGDRRAPAQPAAAPVYDAQTNEVLNTLRNLLGSQNASGAAPAAPGVEEVASQDLVRILSQAQHTLPLQGGYRIEPVNLRDTLKGLLESRQQINQVDDDVINLVGMMFDFILDDRNLAAPMKALLGRLQIPMVKVAIADKSFFSKGGHPARRLLNEMAMAALGWQENSEENQRKDSLFNKMEEVVQRVLSEFDTDISIFGGLLTDFRAFLEKEKRRAQILEQRTLDAEDGKAKSERARAEVDAALNRLLAGHELPEPALKLLRDAWANVMFITCLKQGVESDEWQFNLKTAEQLVWSLTAPMAREDRQQLLKLVPVLLQQLRQGLESIAYNPFETTQLFKQLEGLHLARLRAAAVAPAAAPAAPKPDVAEVAEAAPVETQPEVAPEPVAEQQPPAVEAVSESVAEEAPASAQPVLQETFVVIPEAPVDLDSQHLSLVNNITQGSWFEMTDGNDQKYRCRLAAIIKATGKYIFVNRSGMKVAEETRASLAESLKSGRLRVLDDGMLFDRALEAVIGSLREKRSST
jgi:hypothetical protein